MAIDSAPRKVKASFEKEGVLLRICDILPLRAVSDNVKRSAKYGQIAASIREIGLVEPIVVTRRKHDHATYLLLDGHLRLEVLRDAGAETVQCLVSTDDEAFTYNRRINRLAIIQEHRMILKAIERGVPEERIAKALNIEVNTLRARKQLLNGICLETAELLKDKHVAISTFSILRKMSPLRQIEVAELMVAMNQFSSNYAHSLLAATSRDQLVRPDHPKSVKGITSEQMELMERESANLEREFKLATQSYGTDHLDLVLAKGYLSKLLGNARVVRHLAKHHQDLLAEFHQITDMQMDLAEAATR